MSIPRTVSQTLLGSRSLFDPKEPSQDWEFTAESDNDVANARPEQIAVAIKRGAEAVGKVPTVAAPAMKPK
jgi:hypothetical protein